MCVRDILIGVHNEIYNSLVFPPALNFSPTIVRNCTYLVIGTYVYSLQIHMKYNVEPSLTNVEPIRGRWNHLWPIWQCRAKIGRFLGLLGPPRDIFMGAKNTQMTVPDMKYNVQTSLTNVQPT